MSYLKAVTYIQPDNVVKNDDLFAEIGGESLDQVVKAMGVETRAWVADNQTAGDLAVEAASKLFEEYSIRPEDVDFVLFCSQCMDYFLPSTACIIQDRLGIPVTAGACGFDLGCSGYVYGLAMADSFVNSGLASNVLLLTADTLSRYIHPKDKNRLLFGDAASASVISTDGFAEIGKVHMGTDGSGAGNIMVKNGAGRHSARTMNEWKDESGNLHRDDWFYMDGEAVFNFTVERIPEMIAGCLEKNRLSRDDVDYFIFHQANRYMLNTIRKLNGIPKDHFFVDISDTGNTSSSTVPVGIVKSMGNGTVCNGKTVMLAGFGVGYSWASTILKF